MVAMAQRQVTTSQSQVAMQQVLPTMSQVQAVSCILPVPALKA